MVGKQELQVYFSADFQQSDALSFNSTDDLYVSAIHVCVYLNLITQLSLLPIFIF